MSRTMRTPPPCPPAPAHPPLPGTGQNAQPLARPPQTISRTPFVRQPTPRARPCPPAHRPHRRYRPLHSIAPLLASSTTPLRRRFCASPAQPMCTPHPTRPSAPRYSAAPPPCPSTQPHPLSSSSPAQPAYCYPTHAQRCPPSVRSHPMSPLPSVARPCAAST